MREVPVTTNRVQADRGFVHAPNLPKGPNGRALCRRCSVEVPRGRHTFCGDDCIREWKIKTQPAFLRGLVWERDKGQCALCPTLCSRRNRQHVRDAATGLWHIERGVAWEADHIVPVVEGGGECGLDNIRTLCRPCHVRVTSELRARLAERRRAAADPQASLFLEEP